MLQFTLLVLLGLVVRPTVGQSCEDDDVIDGTTTEWSEWTPCDNRCGQGVTTRDRECDIKPDAYGNSERRGQGTTQQCIDYSSS